MTDNDDYPMGAEIRFRNRGEEILTGTVNGEVYEIEGDAGYYNLVPVYVREGDRCIAVDSRNILEGE